MQGSDSSARGENPAKSTNQLGKVWENGVDSNASAPKYSFGEFQVDTAAQRLLRAGEPVLLRNRPFQVLLYLMAHRGRLVEQSEILASIWGASDVYHDALRKAVGSIRSALGDDSQQPRFIETHWGKGYRFIGEVMEQRQDDRDTGHTPARPMHAPVLAAMAAIEIPAAPAKEFRFEYLGIVAGFAMVALLAGATIAIQGDLLVHRLKQAVAPPVKASAARRPENDAQRTEYIEAQYLLSQRSSESIAQAIGMFKQITETDVRAGDAYAGLAECYGLGYWGFWKIDEERAINVSAKYAEKSVQADPGSAYAHSQLAAALFRQLKVRDAQAEFEKALAIRPESAEVHHAYAVFLDDTRHADSGIQEMKRAIDLEPLSLAYKTDLGMSYFFAKRYGDAIAVYQSVLKLNPGYIEAHEYLASMYVYQEQWAQAKAEYTAIDKLRGTHASENSLSALRIITQLKTGERKKAQAAVEAILSSPSIQHSYSLADVYAQSGRSQDALPYLRQVADSHSLAMFQIPDDPLLTALHNTPEFQAISRQVLNVTSLPAEENPSRPTIALARALIGSR